MILVAHRWGRLVAAAAALALLCACATVDNADSRMEAINRNITDARNKAILLNIARASYGHPLNFVAITSIGGNRSLGGGFGLPSLILGPTLGSDPRHYVFGGNAVSGSASNNFNINPLESKEFYTGLLAPLDLETAQFFISQGFPREIVFYLFVDWLVIRGSGGTAHVANDPDSPAFSRFVDYMHRAVDYGLSLERFGPSNAARLCFDEARALKPLGSLGPVCGDGQPSKGIRNFVEGAYGAVTVELKIRSTYQIFQYLGRLSRRDASGKVALVSPELQRAGEARPGLFPLLREDAGEFCLTSVQYSREHLCVPFDGNEIGGRVLDLLSILVALSSSVRDLPTMQTIRITQ
ncbi:MAG: hypothetical protein AB7G13_09785 [Lautropia sp.]